MTDAKKYKQLKNETLEKSSSILQEAGIWYGQYESLKIKMNWLLG